MNWFVRTYVKEAKGLTKEDLLAEGYSQVRQSWDNTYPWTNLDELPEGEVFLKWENYYREGFSNDIIARKSEMRQGEIVGTTRPLHHGQLVVELFGPSVEGLPERGIIHQSGWIEASKASEVYPLPTVGHLGPNGWVWER